MGHNTRLGLSSHQVLEKDAPEEEPNEWIGTLRELVSQWHLEEDTMDPTFPEEET